MRLGTLWEKHQGYVGTHRGSLQVSIVVGRTGPQRDTSTSECDSSECGSESENQASMVTTSVTPTLSSTLVVTIEIHIVPILGGSLRFPIALIRQQHHIKGTQRRT